MKSRPERSLVREGLRRKALRAHGPLSAPHVCRLALVIPDLQFLLCPFPVILPQTPLHEVMGGDRRETIKRRLIKTHRSRWITLAPDAASGETGRPHSHSASQGRQRRPRILGHRSPEARAHRRSCHEAHPGLSDGLGCSFQQP